MTERLGGRADVDQVMGSHFGSISIIANLAGGSSKESSKPLKSRRQPSYGWRGRERTEHFLGRRSSSLPLTIFGGGGYIPVLPVPT